MTGLKIRPCTGFALLGVLFAMALVVRAQEGSSSSLVLRVEERARVTPGAASLRFVIPADDGLPTPQTVAVSAWVRARRGQRIVISARPSGNLMGDAGEIPVSAVQFAGTTVLAMHGAESASCTQGSLGDNAAVELVAGWQQSGILTCQVAFSLAGRKGLRPGVYSTQLTFSVAAQ